jgi:hypothetical protein
MYRIAEVEQNAVFDLGNFYRPKNILIDENAG